VSADVIKPADEPGAVTGYVEPTAHNYLRVHNNLVAAVACFDGGTAEKAGGQPQALGLAAAVARIRDAVMRVDATAAVPAGAGREVWGRKVVRLDGGLHGSTTFGSARAA
jgi:hypothetical protein